MKVLKLLEMVVDSDSHNVFFFVFCSTVFFVFILAAVLLIYRGHIIAMNLSSLMERNLLEVGRPVEIFFFNNLWMIQSLVTQKVILDCLGEQLARWKLASYLTLKPTVLLIGSIFIYFFIIYLFIPWSDVIVPLSICSQVNRVPAAFTHREYRLQAHAVAAV